MKFLQTIQNIACITHEFGLYEGHGGVATYLDSYLSNFLELQKEGLLSESINLYFLYRHGSDPKEYKNKYPKNIHFIKSPDNIHYSDVIDFFDEQVKTHNIQLIESVDFTALSNKILVNQNIYKEKPLVNTSVSIMHHTGWKEIREWGSGEDFSKIADDLDYAMHNLEKLQFTLADFNMAPSTFLKEYLKNKYKIALETIYYPFNSKKYLKERMDSLNASSEKIIVYATRFEERKKQEKLVEATLNLLEKGISNFKVYFIGSSKFSRKYNMLYSDYVKSIIPDKYKSYYNFFDFMTQQELKEIYKKCHIFIMTSKYENFPLACQESICLGLPVMGCSSTGIKDMVGKELEDLCCFEYDNLNDISSKILKFLNFNNKELKEISDKQVFNLLKIVNTEKTLLNKLQKQEDILMLAQSSDKVMDANRVVLDCYKKINGNVNSGSCHLFVDNNRRKDVINFFLDYTFTLKLKPIVIVLSTIETKVHTVDDFKNNFKINSYILPHFDTFLFDGYSDYKTIVFNEVKKRGIFLNININNLENFNILQV